ncbi:two-component system phosphate regulon sensor histidine kinase PhoR [Thermonema lapsum]|uniref:histidine kinase n=1 Tax=Thermonema lapsum TaxID=28195 RepID=A0A846MR85_9BACT|nr:HAMP domain-containing sensor histidine kinase [Thermonema lapsum]NIK73969.1 two-component system phosphate regulon sensor histidine kinase PhoR [Thermonema lapsum]
MPRSPKQWAVFISVCVAGLTTLFVSLFPESHFWLLLTCFGISFAAGVILNTLALELLIFREVNQLYTSLNKIKKKDFKLAKRQLATISGPLQDLHKEIYSYAAKKQKEIDDLVKLEAFRREFIADISHELKTPIFAAQGYIQTLLDGAIDDEEVRYVFLERANKSLEGLEHLVQDLLMLSQMEMGVIKMNFQQVDLHRICEEVFEQLQNKAAARSIELQLESPRQCIAWADPQRIRQVFINLVENGIKYGKEGGFVRVRLLSADSTDRCQVVIEDNGVGIPKKHLHRIFDRFYRVEKSRSKESGGSGLGLAIVKQIILAHHSEIEVKSKVDEGTRFSFYLFTKPQAVPSAPTGASAQIPTTEA